MRSAWCMLSVGTGKVEYLLCGYKRSGGTMFDTFYRWAILTTLGVIASDKDDDKGTEDDEDGAEGPFL